MTAVGGHFEKIWKMLEGSLVVVDKSFGSWFGGSVLVWDWCCGEVRGCGTCGQIRLRFRNGVYQSCTSFHRSDAQAYKDITYQGLSEDDLN
jgi:hypothetical protein